MTSLCWLRRDLRLHDHAALSKALESGETYVAFIFDSNILNKLTDKSDKRITFIYESLIEIEKLLQKKGSSLLVRYGRPEEEIPKLVEEYEINRVFSNRDYEPYAKKRDFLVAKKLKTLSVDFEQFKDSVFFEKHEVLTNSRGIYKVFTPYKNKWIEHFEARDKNIPHYHCDLKNLAPLKNDKNIISFDWYKKIGFEKTVLPLKPGTKAAINRLEEFSSKIPDYHEARDFPFQDGTSSLSPYLRFGNLSLRDMMRIVSPNSEGSKTWLSELIWRDFYQMILDTHPQVEHESFKREYDQIKWQGKEEHFKAWCEGQTGFPIVDSAMRCLNETGMMHNRLRMIVASFLCKILLVDWKKGEKYFAEKLLDFDLAANNGGWQWSSSSGCDAQPYFRIFNPYTQSEKFDAEGSFIKKWIPELRKANKKEIHRPDTLNFSNYPSPIVSYEKNRERCLVMYSVVKK